MDNDDLGLAGNGWDGIRYKVSFWVGIGMVRIRTVNAKTLHEAYEKACDAEDALAYRTGREPPLAWTLILRSMKAIPSRRIKRDFKLARKAI